MRDICSILFGFVFTKRKKKFPSSIVSYRSLRLFSRVCPIYPEPATTQQTFFLCFRPTQAAKNPKLLSSPILFSLNSISSHALWPVRMKRCCHIHTPPEKKKKKRGFTMNDTKGKPTMYTNQLLGGYLYQRAEKASHSYQRPENGTKPMNQIPTVVRYIPRLDH